MGVAVQLRVPTRVGERPVEEPRGELLRQDFRAGAVDPRGIDLPGFNRGRGDLRVEPAAHRLVHARTQRDGRSV